MKKTLKKTSVLLFVAAALFTFSACKEDYSELVVGQWEVKTAYHWSHDFTDESLSWEETLTPTDSNYIGYDSLEFYANGTMRWHMNDLYCANGMFDNPNVSYEWRIDGDSLLLSHDWVNVDKYAIKTLDKKNLVIEQYTNNEHEEYSHHHLEQIHRYTLNRCTKK